MRIQADRRREMRTEEGGIRETEKKRKRLCVGG